MATEVAIKIRIDDSNVGDTLSRIEKALTDAGVSGETSVRKLGQGLDQLGGHAASNLDKVRLLSQEFGLRLPRALEAMLSRIPAVTTAIGGMTAGIAGIAIAEVFVRAGEAIYNAEQKYISITAAADKYYEVLKKTSELDFTNTRDLATTQRRLGDATAAMATDPRVAAGLQRSGLLNLLGGNIALGVGEIGGAKSTADEGAVKAGQMVELTKKQLDQQHEAALAQIELNHALDGTLEKRAQISAEVAKAQQLAAENRAYNTKVERNYGNAVPGDAGSVEEQRQINQAKAEATAKTIDLNNQVAAARIKADSEAVESGLQGEALYNQKRKDAIRELIAELNAQHLAEEIPARVRDLNTQYDNERQARVRELTEQTRQMTAEASQAGLTGAARILADRQSQISAIDERQKKFSGGAALDPAARQDFDEQRAAASSAAYQKLTALNDQFTAHANELAAQRAEMEEGAFGRIDAAANRELASLKKTYDEDVSGLQDADELKISATEAYNTAVAAINASADAQKKELRERNAAEDARYDQEAAQAEARVRQNGIAGWLSGNQRAITEIQQQEQQRLAKLQEDATKEGLTYEEVAKRRADIERSANAEVAESNEQLQHTIAGQLQSAFTNPVKFIQQKMEQMMFEIIAGWIVRLHLFQDVFGSTMGGLQPGGSAGASGGAAAGSGAGAAVLSGTSGSLGSIMRGVMRPSGTSGVIDSGTTLPPGYVDGGSTSSGGSGSLGVTGGPAAGSGLGAVTGSTAGAGGGVGDQVSSTIGGLSSLARTFHLGQPQSTTTAPGGAGTTGTNTGVAGTAGATGGLAAGAATALTYAGAGAAAYSGVEGVMAGFHTGGAKGALDSTASGAAVGAAIGSIVPGLGTVIGGVIGAAAGLTTNLVGDAMGESGRFAARDYYRNTLFPSLEQIRRNPTGGGYLSQISDANKTASQGVDYMSQKFGQGAAAWVNDNYLKKELNDVDTAIERRARGGSQYLGRSASEFHTGGVIGGFGDLGTTSTEGYIHAMLGEGIVNTPAMQTHGAAIMAMNSGASAAEMAQHYLKASGTSTLSPGSASGDTHHWNVQAMDSKSFEKFLDGGGAATVNKSLNKFVSRYAGDGQAGA